MCCGQNVNENPLDRVDLVGLKRHVDGGNCTILKQVGLGKKRAATNGESAP